MEKIIEIDENTEVKFKCYNGELNECGGTRLNVNHLQSPGCVVRGDRGEGTETMSKRL